jgi:hypothetical protein
MAFRAPEGGGTVCFVFIVILLFFLDLSFVGFEPRLRLRLRSAGNKRGMDAPPGGSRTPGKQCSVCSYTLTRKRGRTRQIGINRQPGATGRSHREDLTTLAGRLEWFRSAVHLTQLTPDWLGPGGCLPHRHRAEKRWTLTPDETDFRPAGDDHAILRDGFRIFDGGDVRRRFVASPWQPLP